MANGVHPQQQQQSMSPKQGSAETAHPSKRRKTSNIFVKDPPKFDLESYISNYEGRTRLDRLRTIANCSKTLGPEAVRLGALEASSGKDVDTFQEFVSLYKSIRPGGALPDIPDQNAVRMNALVAKETDRLENDLKGYKNNLIKESIRLGNDDLGQHYYKSGNLTEAYKTFHGMRDYCTLPKHAAEMYLKLVLTAAAQQNWMVINRDLSKLRSLTLKPEDTSKVFPFLIPIDGLAQLCTGAYGQAAQLFLNSDPTYGTLDPVAGVKPSTEILTINDIATYGGLCALATLSRTELNRKVLNNERFRSFLELESHLRRAIVYFCNAKYTQCLEILESYRNDYLLDVHLQSHVDALYAMIRRKSIIAYTAPFSQVSISSMGQAFGVSEGEMEKELLDIIKSGDLDARLDLVEMLLVSRQTNERVEVQEKALEVAREHERGLRLKLYRINMLQAGFEIKAAQNRKERGGDGFLDERGGSSGGGGGGGGFSGMNMKAGRSGGR